MACLIFLLETELERRKGSCVLVQFSDFGLGRGFYIAKALSLLGLKVSIVSNRPVYASNGTSQKNSISDSSMKVVDFRIPFIRTLYRSVLGRLIVYILFSMFSFVRMLMLAPQPKTLYSRGPQPFTEISCILYKLFNRDVKIVSGITDLWPDALEYVQMNATLRSFLKRIGHAINSLMYLKVDAIVTLNEELSKILVERLERTTHIIYGAIDLEKFKPMDKREALPELRPDLRKKVNGKFVVLYAGLIGAFQNPLVISEIAKRIAEENDIVILVVGTGPLRNNMAEEVEKNRLKNVLIFETQPFEKMPYIYNSADLCLLTYAPLQLLRVGLPKKFIEYAACGKPILCISPRCVASNLCLEWKAGYHVDCQDVESAVDYIKALKSDEKLRENTGKNARRLAEQLFSLDSASKILKKIVHS